MMSVIIQSSIWHENKSRACLSGSSSLCYKPMIIVNDNARIIKNLDASLTDDARVIIYDSHMFIVQATGFTAKEYIL
jgi:hypothetical protein